MKERNWGIVLLKRSLTELDKSPDGDVKMTRTNLISKDRADKRSVEGTMCQRIQNLQWSLS